ncbi:TIGR03759 family integrating conjugative element protein [Halomonas elongata]|uniref:TIGR03759 family integrating conjugative element protein n=1 Tax=Halomonas elongata TaxID=2746 RepID=UPI0023B1BD04|nr:TIGR03759 family integrating conjugative element protein [Halomonas elongata]
MTRNALCVMAAAILPCLALPAWGQSIQDAEETQQRDSTVSETVIERSQQRAADAWGLDQQEYQRYKTIMEGPRGTWSPDLDPLTALGLEARSDAERQKYAELLVEIERKRVEAELAFQRAYDDAWQRLYPGDMPVNSFTTKGGIDATQSVFGDATASSSPRLNVVVATQACGQCDATVKRLLSNGAAMDIWIVDSEGDDERIRRWAAKVGIPPDQVRNGSITLNHGGSYNFDSAELPRVAPRG